MKVKKVILLSLLAVTTISVVAAYLIINKDKNTTYYTVSFDSNGGTEIAPIKVAKDTLVPKPRDPIKTGYFVSSWNINDRVWNFKTDVVNQDIELLAMWNIETYTITYNEDGGTMPETYETTYTIESNFELVRPTKEDVIFSGWFDVNGNRIDSIIPGMTGNIILDAKWTTGFFPISEDETKGTINVYSSETNPNEFTLVNNPVNNQYHLFKGWYDKNGSLLSENPEYTVIINPEVNYYIYSKYMSESEETEWNDSHGVNPVIHSNDSTPYITYGMYPQSNVNDDDLINALEHLTPTKFNDYYYHNHEYYTKKTAVLARDLNTHEQLSVKKFDNGDEFAEDETYWFRVEPLSWKIQKQSNNEYSLVSDKLLEVKKYHKNSSIRTIDDTTIYSNNYKYSDIREWLNGDFATTAFAFNNSSLNIFEVDNRKETTATPDSGFECENTFDYVTLLSYNECEQKTFAERQIKTTDYVRVCGANYSVSSRNLFSGYYWTRSPLSTDKDNGTAVSRCNMNGALNDDFVGWGGSCVQPVITVTL